MTLGLPRMAMVGALLSLVAAGVSSLFSTNPAGAEPLAEFYKGKRLSLIISVGEGDGMDKMARLVARHWSRHIPGNPTIVPRNMPGAGSLRAANFLYNQAPQDGTTLGAIIPAFVMHQVLGGSGVDYDAAKFHWLGSSNTSNATIYVWHTTGVTSLTSAVTQELMMGGTGVGSNSVHYPTILNHILGTKFRIVMGYRAAPDINLAVQRGEVQGRAGETFNTLLLNNPSWIRDRKINILVQIGRDKERGFEAVPLLVEFATEKRAHDVLQLFSDEIALGRPYLAPPGVPPERVAMLRSAFEATMRDHAFLADANSLRLTINPTSGAILQTLVAGLINTQLAVLAQAKAALRVDNASVRKIGGPNNQNKSGSRR